MKRLRPPVSYAMTIAPASERRSGYTRMHALGDGSVQQLSENDVRQHLAQTGDQSNCVLKP